MKSNLLSPHLTCPPVSGTGIFGILEFVTSSKTIKKNLDEYCTWECIQYKKHNFITVFSDLGETWSLAAACFDITRKYAEAVITLLAVSNQIRHSANK